MNLHWPWHHEAPGMQQAQQALAQSEEGLALSEHLQAAAEGQAKRLQEVRRRNGLVEAVRAEWRRER